MASVKYGTSSPFFHGPDSLRKRIVQRIYGIRQKPQSFPLFLCVFPKMVPTCFSWYPTYFLLCWGRGFLLASPPSWFLGCLIAPGHAWLCVSVHHPAAARKSVRDRAVKYIRHQTSLQDSHACLGRHPIRESVKWSGGRRGLLLPKRAQRCGCLNERSIHIAGLLCIALKACEEKA